MLLNEKIINSKIGIFLGAGSSAPFNKLLMSTFVENILLKEPLADDVKSLLSFLCTAKKIDLEEILEDVNLFKEKKYYLTEKYISYLNDFTESFKKMRNIANRLDYIIRKKLIEHYRSIDDVNLICEKYNPLFELIKTELNISPLLIPIFTTNYDDVIEALCRYQDDKYNLINGTKYERRYGSEILSLEEFNNFTSVPNKTNIILLKLHGSICWELDPKQKIIRINPQPIFDDYDPEVTKVYIAPTKAKIALDLPYNILYEYLQRALDNALLFISVGYSFRDYDTLAKIKSSLNFNEKLKLIILDPKAEQLKKELFEGYEKRIICLPYYFGSADESSYLDAIRAEI